MQEPVEETIEVNQGYKLIPAMTGQKRKLCFVAGRQGNAITLLLVSGIATATVVALRARVRQGQDERRRVQPHALQPCEGRSGRGRRMRHHKERSR